MLKKKRKDMVIDMLKRNDVWYKKDPLAVKYRLSSCSPLCFVTWGHQPLRRAHWPSASARLLVDTPLSCQINKKTVSIIL